MENQGFRLVEEKKQKKSYFALILSIFTVAGILLPLPANVCGYKMVVCFDVCVHYL